MSKLVLAEKPSVAQSIAKVLGANKRCDGYLSGEYRSRKGLYLREQGASESGQESYGHAGEKRCAPYISGGKGK